MEKRILYIIPRFSTGGAEELVFQYARFFSSQGYKVAVASVVGGGELVSKFENLDIKLYVSQEKGFKSWQGLKHFTKGFKPDIIHSHIFSGDLAGYLLSKKNKKLKWISTQHNVEFGNSLYKRLIWKHVLSKADKIIAVSKNVSDYDKQVFGVSAKKIKLVLNGIDLAFWKKVGVKDFGKSGVWHLATVGRLEKQKGYEFLIEALGNIKNKNWHWHVFGVGSLEASLKKLAKTKGLEKQITWHGVSGNLNHVYESIDLVVQPSLWEGLSLVIMEAMAAGRVVIASEVAGKELIKNEITGFIFQTKDIKDLSKVIETVLDENNLKKIAKSARIYAEKNFSIENNLKAIRGIYESF